MKNTDPRLRLPPQDLDSERAVLGSIMLRHGALYEIADMIDADAFYADKNKTIFLWDTDIS